MGKGQFSGHLWKTLEKLRKPPRLIARPENEELDDLRSRRSSAGGRQSAVQPLVHLPLCHAAHTGGGSRSGEIALSWVCGFIIGGQCVIMKNPGRLPVKSFYWHTTYFFYWHSLKKDNLLA
jgi:hypothetical protein